MMPKMICSPPKLNAISHLAAAAGKTTAAAPQPMNIQPMIGTALTENAPPLKAGATVPVLSL